MRIIIGDPRHAGWEALKKEKSGKKVGAGLQSCFAMKDLFRMAALGFTPAERVHIRQCFDCRVSYSNFMKIRRNEARMATGQNSFEDQVERDLGERPKHKIG